MVIARYGTDLPYWDQWAKEGELLYAPWFERHELWHNLFVPHNEHRMAPTLAMNWLLLRLGGDQWDARVQCVASAALYAALMAGIAAWGLRRRDRLQSLAGAPLDDAAGRAWRLRSSTGSSSTSERGTESAPYPLRGGDGAPSSSRCDVGAVGLCLLLVVVAAPPIAWENVLGGFQSVFYFLAIFSALAIAGLLGSPAWSWRWCGGLVAATLACVSMGSGMLVAGPIAVVAGMRLMARKRIQGLPPSARNDALATLGAAAVIGAVGWALRPHAPWHEALHAHSLLEYTHYAAQCLAWPLYHQPWLAAIVWAPWAVLGWRWAFRGRVGEPAMVTSGAPPSRGPVEIPAGYQRARRLDFIVAGGCWVLLQTAAVTYSRAGAGGLPAPRYGDIMALGVAFNAIALVCLARGHPKARTAQTGTDAATVSGTPSPPAPPGRDQAAPFKGFIASIVLVWAAIVTVAIGVATRDAFRGPLPAKKADAIAYEHNVQAFVLTDDYVALEKAAPLIPFPLTDWLARMLRNPTLRRLLPQSVRAPLHIPELDDAPNTGNSPRASPATTLPPLEHRATRTLTAPGEWRSEPLPAMTGRWKIETGGDIGKPGAVLELRAVADDRVLATIAPTKPAGTGWRAAYVAAPREPARLYAAVKPPAHILAFSEPIEMSSLSFWTWRLVEHARWLVVAAMAGLLGFGLAVTRTTQS